MTAHETLERLLEVFREAVPGVEFRDAYGPGPASRRHGRALVAGRVEQETISGENWSARLGFTVYLPAAGQPAMAWEIASAMDAAARDSQELLTETVLGPVAEDGAFGGVAMGIVFRFAAPGESGPGASAGKWSGTASLNGREFAVTGWKESVSLSGEGLTAIGEDVPFYQRQGREYTIELQGLGAAALGIADGFVLQLGGQNARYGNCRWKSRSGSGTAVAVSSEKTEGE